MAQTYTQRQIAHWMSIAIISMVVLGFFAGFQVAKLNFTISLVAIGLMVGSFLVFRFAVTKLYCFVEGAKGEMKVNTILSEMTVRGFRYIHDITLGPNGNVDHVVIGPTGIWAIETKQLNRWLHLSHKLMTPEQYIDIKGALDQAYAESQSVRQFFARNAFDVNVEPVLVFTGNTSKIEFGLKKVRGVYVVGFTWLQKLLDQPNTKRIYTKKQVDQIYLILKGEKQRQIDA